MEQQNVRTTIQPGQHIESWTVLDAFTYSKRNEKKWLCRCACGSENELMNVDGGMPFIVGALAAGGIVVGSAVVVGGVTYGVKKLCEWVGSKF